MNYVLGAGLSGISFCYFNGNNNTILEKSGQLGGRIRSIGKDKSWVEVGAQFYSKADPNIYGLITELNLNKKEKEVKLSEFSVNYGGKIIQLKNKKSTQISEEEVMELKRFYDVVNKVDQIIEEFPDNLINTSFEKWYASEIGKETKWLINGMTKAITFSKPSNLAAIYGIAVCGTFFNKCFTIENGIQEINKTLINISRPEVIFNAEIENINIQNNTIKSIEYLNNKIKIDNNLISAIPSNNLAKIITDTELTEQLQKITYNGCAVVILNINKQILKHDSGILFSDPKEVISVIIDEPEYYDFQRREHLIGILFPYKQRPKEKYLIDCAIKKLNEISNNDFKIIDYTINYWDYGLPEFNKNIFRAQQRIIEITANYSNFAICGDFMGLPSLDACVESAKKAVEKIKNKT